MKRPSDGVTLPLLLLALWLTPLLGFGVAAPGSATPGVQLKSGPLGGAAGRRAGPVLLAVGADGRPMLFHADFDTRDWSGRFSRMALEDSGDGGVQAGATLWEAGQLLDGPAADGDLQSAPERSIATFGDGTSAAAQGVALRWEQLSEAQRGWLDAAPAGDSGTGPGNGSGADSGAADGLGPQRLDFLRGGRSLEAGQPGALFRRRGSLLGDAINSVPVLVGAPRAGVQGAGYEQFYTQHLARRNAVYLGANDGMLHAFDAASGSELFAYVPGALMPTLNALTGLPYAHRNYVDGGAVAAEVRVADGWKTVLVSGMGGGAQGVFALDVSDPARWGDGAAAAAAGAGALWEFGDLDDAAMGNVLAAPALAKFRVGMLDGAADYRHFAVVASGWNNYVDDGEKRYAASGAGALFLLALDKAAADPWRRGRNYYRLDTPHSEPASANALAAPALVPGAGGAVRYVYVGDLQGNLWCFDFASAAAWFQGDGAAPPRRLVFVARDASGQRQPITQQVRVAFAPGGGYLLLFGTGKLVEDSDLQPSSFLPQAFYAVRDVPAEFAGAAAPGETPGLAGRAGLAPRTLQQREDGGGYILSGAPFVYAGAAAKRGWYVDFPDTPASGERSVSDAVLMAGKVFFNTALPGRGTTAGPAARAYAVDILTGLTFDAGGMVGNGNSTAGLLPEGSRGAPQLLASGGATVDGDAGPGQRVVRVDVGVTPAAGTAVTVSNVTALPARAGRLSWREVANWRDLHASGSP